MNKSLFTQIARAKIRRNRRRDAAIKFAGQCVCGVLFAAAWLGLFV